jgi:hypothetical protein
MVSGRSGSGVVNVAVEVSPGLIYRTRGCARMPDMIALWGSRDCDRLATRIVQRSCFDSRNDWIDSGGRGPIRSTAHRALLGVAWRLGDSEPLGLRLNSDRRVLRTRYKPGTIFEEKRSMEYEGANRRKSEGGFVDDRREPWEIQVAGDF